MRCGDQCEIRPGREIYLLAFTLILSYFYICFLIYTYFSKCREMERREKREEKRGQVQQKREDEEEIFELFGG
jgi:hypothetical protein